MDTLNQRITVRANNFNIAHFNSIGYFPKLNEYIEIFVKELPTGSGLKIDVECNYCGEIVKKSYRRFLETEDDLCCDSCKQEKMMKTSLAKYGNICSLRNEIVLEKSKKTNMKKLGVEFPFQDRDILKKCRDTTIEKYGKLVTFGWKVSKQQAEIHSVFGGIMNYNEFPYLLDIFFEKEKIYFEYDGSGHKLNVKIRGVTEEEFEEKESRRELFLYEKGYKQFRIKSSTDNLPERKELLKIKKRAFKLLLKNNLNKYVYDLDTKIESFE